MSRALIASIVLCASTLGTPARADMPSPGDQLSERARRLGTQLADPSAKVRAAALAELTLPLDGYVRAVLERARWSEADAGVVGAIDRLLVPNAPAPRDAVRAEIMPLALCGNQQGPSLVDGIWMALHELGTGVDEVLIAIASDPKEAVDVRASAFAWLARFPSKAGLAFLQAQLQKTDAGPALMSASASAYMAAFFGTRRPWEKSAGGIEETFWASHFDDVGAYARAFGPPRVADVLPQLVRRLGHPDYEVRRVAAFGLGFIDTPEAKAALRAAAQKEKDGGVLTAIHDSLRDSPPVP